MTGFIKWASLCALSVAVGLIGSGRVMGQYPIYPVQPTPIYQPTYPVIVNPPVIGPIYPQPSFPVAITPPTVTGYNPYTGGFNTANTQINNTAFDPFRNSSMYNGTMQQVNRPVYNSMGQIVGWERGVQWVNSVTGQLHGNTSVVTPNAFGGQQNTNVHYSIAPPRR